GSLLSRFMREAAGVRSIAMNQDEIRDFEPTLSPTFRSGMLLPDNGRTTNPGRLVKVLGEEAFRLGAEFVQGQVTEVQFEGERVRAIRVGGERRPVDILLVAAGAASGELSRQLRTKIPIEAERGY